MECGTKSAAMKVYERGVMKTMSMYVLIILGVAWTVRHHHPTGVVAYVLAVLPALPIMGMLAVMGVYLRDEKDEFLRWMMIQALLWATGVTLAVCTVIGFLQSFAAMRAPEMFWVFVLYWPAFGVARVILKLSYNRQAADE